MGGKHGPVAERFWRKVSKTDGCWLWTAGLDGHGYGQVFDGEKGARAHRVSWMLTIGEIPEGLSVLHKCDVRTCVNPEHLFLGTIADNVSDMVTKGRNVVHRGEGHGMAVLTKDDVARLRARRKDGATCRQLASEFGISNTQAKRIVRGEQWRDV